MPFLFLSPSTQDFNPYVTTGIGIADGLCGAACGVVAGEVDAGGA